jgi:hypothetical protein
MIPQFSKYRTILLTGFLAAIILFSSCYTYRVATHAQAGSEPSNTVTAHAFFWGLVQKPAQIHTADCDSLQVNGMSEVTIKTNLGFAFITVATLGIWCPVKVEWRCSKPCKKIGSL